MTKIIAWGQYSFRSHLFQPPGNSLRHIDVAYGFGYDGVELDVQLAKDDVLVLMHDGTLDRTTDCRGAVNAKTSSELSFVRIKDPWKGPPCYVATLASALERNGHRGPVMIDTHHVVPRTVGALRRSVEQSCFDEKLLLLLTYDVAGGRLYKKEFPAATVLLKARHDVDLSSLDLGLVDRAEGLDGLLLPIANNAELRRAFREKTNRKGLKLAVYMHDSNADVLREIVADRIDYVTSIRPEDFGGIKREESADTPASSTQKRDKSRLSLISDPLSAALPGVNVAFLAEEEYRRISHVRTWSDPMGVGFGKPLLPPLVKLTRYTLELDSRWVLDGHRSFVYDGHFFVDKVVPPNEVSRLFHTDSSSGVSFSEDGFSYAGQSKEVLAISGRVGVALSAEPSNWGSFLVRVLPKAIELRRLGCEKLLVWCNNARQLEALSLAGWDEGDLIRFKPSLRYRMDTAVFPSEWTSNLYVSPASLSLLRGLTPDVRTPYRRIYVSRRGGLALNSSRVCVNASEVESAMAALSMEIVVPDALSVAEQIELFSSASLVVGPSGAGMFNSVFCQPGVNLVDIESQENWLWGHMNLFSSLGANFSVVLGRADLSAENRHKPFMVDVPDLVSVVGDHLLS